MPVKELAAEAVGIPEYSFDPANGVSAFDLSSHARAGQALQFGLDTPGNDHNVYVLGLDRSGRMTATRELSKHGRTGDRRRATGSMSSISRRRRPRVRSFFLPAPADDSSRR